MGKRSRSKMTGLNKQQRIRRSIEKKEEENRRARERARRMLQYILSVGDEDVEHA